MKIATKTASMIALIGTMALATQAELIHRYELNQDLNDSIGAISGKAVGVGTNGFGEDVIFNMDIPAGAIAEAPTYSMQVGMNAGSKKSGFKAPGVLLSTTNSGSVSMWVKTTAAIDDGEDYILMNYLNVGETRINTVSGTLAADVKIGDHLKSNGLSLGNDLWTHIVLTWNAGGVATIYQNGSATYTSPAAAVNATPLSGEMRFGNKNVDNRNGDNLNNQFAGSYYDIQIYDEALTATEAQSLYENPGSAIAEFAPPASSGPITMLHRYEFNMNYDDSVGGDPGFPIGEGTNGFGEEVLFNMDTPAGAIAEAPTYSMQVGMNQGTKKSGMTADDALLTTTNSGSISLWVKPTLGLADGEDYVFISYLFDYNTMLRVNMRSGSLAGDAKMQAQWGGSTLSFQESTWSHVVMTWDTNGVGTVYQNGTAVFVTNPNSVDATPIDKWSRGDLRLGNKAMDNRNNSGMGNQFAGSFYDLQVYDDALEAPNVEYLYENPGSMITKAAAPGWNGYVDFYGLSGDPAADFDADGQSDLYEYALAGHATNPAVQGVDTFLVYQPSDTVEFHHVETTHIDPGITYLPEWTANLAVGSWNSSWASETNNPTADPNYAEAVRTVPGGDKDEVFFRLKVSQP